METRLSLKTDEEQANLSGNASNPSRFYSTNSALSVNTNLYNASVAHQISGKQPARDALDEYSAFLALNSPATRSGHDQPQPSPSLQAYSYRSKIKTPVRTPVLSTYPEEPDSLRTESLHSPLSTPSKPSPHPIYSTLRKLGLVLAAQGLITEEFSRALCDAEMHQNPDHLISEINTLLNAPPAPWYVCFKKPTVSPTMRAFADHILSLKTLTHTSKNVAEFIVSASAFEIAPKTIQQNLFPTR